MWRVVIISIVAVALVVTVTSLAEPQRVAGLPRASTPPEEEKNDPYEPVQLAEFEPGRYPKEYGFSSDPDPGVMEVRGESGYVAFTTHEIVHVTAFDLTDGEIKWNREINLNAPIGALSMVATNTGLLFVINPPGYFQFTISLDPETGEDQWHLSEEPLTVTGVANDRLLFYNSDQDMVHAHGLDDPTAQPTWSVAADGGRVTEIFQETAATRRLPRDDGDDLSIDIGANPDEDQYIVHAAMYSGAISVRELSTGTVLAEGNAGETMMDVVAYEDTIFAYRQTPRTLAAYDATDLSTPKWSVETPPSADGSDLAVCAENVLCLKTVTDQGMPIFAFDATSGELRWQTTDYQTTPVMAGKSVAVAHQDGAALLDPASGDVLAEVDSPSFALPGDDVVIGFGEEIQLLAPGATEPISLGAVPTPAMPAGECEWTPEVALCAGDESYQLWRYRD
jgi:outer membrane protein assembly factor BamB